MSTVQQEIAAQWPFKDHAPKRVVVKVGSNVLSLPQGGLNRQHIGSLVRSIVKALNLGVELILVSSGAVSAGRGVLGLEKRPTSIPELQAVAAIGQGVLMEEYTAQFRRYGMIVAQMLLNRDDMEDRRRYLNARYALTELLERGVVPIINENDCVTIDELKFGDNDFLSAMIAAKMDADLLVIMSNVPGLMTAHPREPGAKLIPVVPRITAEHEAMISAEQSSLGLGGMSTKLHAAHHASQFGVTCVLVNGMKDGKIERVLEGKFEGTLFLPTALRRPGSSRRHWLFSVRPKGRLSIDEGAVRALVHDGKSLLAVGIKGVDGDFSRGDVVSVTNGSGDELAHGVVNYDSGDVRAVMGKKGDQLAAILGSAAYPEVIHRNNLVVLAEESES